MNDDELIELYRETQAVLRRGGGPAAIAAVSELERQMVIALDLDPWDDAAMECMLDELHRLAFPDATARPDRIVLGKDWSRDPRPARSPLAAACPVTHYVTQRAVLMRPEPLTGQFMRLHNLPVRHIVGFGSHGHDLTDATQEDCVDDSTNTTSFLNWQHRH